MFTSVMTAPRDGRSMYVHEIPASASAASVRFPVKCVREVDDELVDG